MTDSLFKLANQQLGNLNQTLRSLETIVQARQEKFLGRGKIDAQLLSGELDEQSDPRITFHLDDEQHILGFVDQELEKLDAD